VKYRISPKIEWPAAQGVNEHARTVPVDVNRHSLIEALNEFLEGERAGARTARAFAAESADARMTSLMRRVAKDEAWCCGMLTKHIERLGGEASRKTGAFFEKAMRRQGEQERLEYLNKGQTWVIHKLNELLLEISDRLLQRDLSMMLRMHERNVKRCAGFNP
jgi:nitronate monooxygenase